MKQDSISVTRRWLAVTCTVLFFMLSNALVFLPGCDAVSSVTDSQRIVGKWKGSLDSIEFLSNGDYKIYATLATWNGKWEIAGGRIKVTMDSSLYPNHEWRYELSGKVLKLTDMRGSTTLQYEFEK